MFLFGTIDRASTGFGLSAGSIRTRDHQPDHPWHKAYILDRCFHLAIAKEVYEKAAACDLFLDHPGMCVFGMFDTHRADELFDIGYKQALLHREKWLALAHDACHQPG